MTAPEFVSEPVRPDPGTFDAATMTRGLAGLPTGFTWRERHFDIVECLDHVKQSAHERGRVDGERYLRRQQFTVRLDDGRIAKIYSERATGRWFLLTIEPESGLNSPRT